MEATKAVAYLTLSGRDNHDNARKPLILTLIYCILTGRALTALISIDQRHATPEVAATLGRTTKSNKKLRHEADSDSDSETGEKTQKSE